MYFLARKSLVAFFTSSFTWQIPISYNLTCISKKVLFQQSFFYMARNEKQYSDMYFQKKDFSVSGKYMAKILT